MSHFDQLNAAFQHEFANARHARLPEGSFMERDGNRYWWVYDANGNEIIRWECRPFPGCCTLVITTKVELRDDLRGLGLGRFFRELRHKAYARAGFTGELATVRSDNDRQNALMVSMGATPMGEFRSDFGGTFKLWCTRLVPLQAQPETPMPQRDAAYTPRPPRWVGEALPDAEEPVVAPAAPAPAPTPPGRRVKSFAHRRAP